MRSQKISFNGLSQAFEQTYAYDDLNRLQSAEEKINATTTWKQTFQFDRFGNRRLDAANTTTIGASNKVTNPLITTSDNRLKKDQDNDLITDYDYDKNGNLTQDSEGKTFLYDAENHQKEVKINGVSKGKYLYDGDGKRVKKISDLETTIFVYNGGGQLVAEYSTQQSTTPQVSYLTQDHLGSPRIITDNTGKVIARKDFNAFGDETNSTQRTTALGYKPEEIRQDYTGYQKDDESGLEFAQARYYNNKHGRFTSVDPLVASANVKDPQTFNRYTYALNSPYKFTDPLGLLSVSTGACGQCQNVDRGGGGAFDSAGNGSGFSEDVETEQTAETPKPPPPIDSSIAGSQEYQEWLEQKGPDASAPIILGDAVYTANSSFTPKNTAVDLTQINAVALDNFVNTTSYFPSFTLEIIERGSGNVRTDYKYEVSYDDGKPLDPLTGIQKVADNGVILIQPTYVAKQTTSPEAPLPTGYEGKIDKTLTGTVTIYGSNSNKIGTTSFKAIVSGDNGVYDISIIETRRTVGKITWNRPSP